MDKGCSERVLASPRAGFLHPRWALWSLLWLVLLPACGRPVPQLPPLGSDAVLLAFGDSLTFGTGARSGASYPAQLERLTGLSVINAGVPGELAGDGLERLEGALSEHAPQLLILCHGGNDILRKRDDPSIQASLERMIRLSRAKGVPVLLLGVPRPALFGLEGARLYYDVAERLQLPLEGEVIAEVLSQRELKSDQVHPNAEGYRRIAEAVVDLLQRSGAL